MGCCIVQLTTAVACVLELRLEWAYSGLLARYQIVWWVLKSPLLIMFLCGESFMRKIVASLPDGAYMFRSSVSE